MADHVSPATSPTQGSSRSESSSPTSVRPRARASSADDSSKKEIRQNRDKGERKETIEDWEIPIDDIFIGPRIGAGSFGLFSLKGIDTIQASHLLVCRNRVSWSLARCGRHQDSQRSRSNSRPGSVSPPFEWMKRLRDILTNSTQVTAFRNEVAVLRKTR